MSLAEFNEWYGDKGEKLHIYRDEKWIAKYAFKAGQQSQQDKIDEVNEKHSEEKRILHNVIEMNQTKIDELQARIDKVICILDKGICHVGSEALFNILTGEDQ